MMRLALPVVLTVVIACSGFLQAGCNNPAHASDCGCNEAPPVYNTNFPGTCRECPNGFAYSLWADYCQTKRYGPAYRFPRNRGCTSCQPACESSASCDASAVVASPVDASPVEPATVDLQPSPPPLRADYYGAPRYESKPAYAESPADSELSIEQPTAEFDESTMPDAVESAAEPPVIAAPPASDVDDIKRSVDEAVEGALKASGDSVDGAVETIDDRSANYRQPWLKIFRPRNR